MVGRLGALRLQPGFYVYLGSALGPGGLRARIARHLRRAKRWHWHIDYLRAYTRPDRLWYSADASRREHRWAMAMQAMPGATAIDGFGASDCKCVSHLFHFEERPSPGAFRRRLRELDPDHPPVVVFCRPATIRELRVFFQHYKGRTST